MGQKKVARNFENPSGLAERDTPAAESTAGAFQAAFGGSTLREHAAEIEYAV